MRRLKTLLATTASVAVVLSGLSACTLASGPADAQRVVVDGTGSLDVQAPGVGHIHADAGSISPGVVDIKVVTGADADNEAIAVVGKGLDVVTSRGATIRKPLTVSFDAVAPEADLVPIIAHKGDDGAWDYLSPDWDGRSAVVRTAKFSVNLLVWVRPSDWIQKIKEWVNAEATGRTPPSACPAGAHRWADVVALTDFAHVCVTNNDDALGERVQIEITSSRAEYLQVDVPEGPDYIWVAGQPDTYRSVLGKRLGFDPRRTVLLAPGGRMTLGYRKPATAASYPISISAALGPATFMTTMLAVLSLGGADTKAVADEMPELLANCGAESVLKDGLQSDTVWSAMKCMVKEGSRRFAVAKKGAAGLAWRVILAVIAAKDVALASVAQVADTLSSLYSSGRTYDSIDLTLTPPPAVPAASAPPRGPETPGATSSTPVDSCPGGDSSGGDHDGACGAAPPAPSNASTAAPRNDICPGGDFSGNVQDGSCGSAPVPPTPTWSEQSGTHGSPTFTNPANASGPGPTIGARTWVQVACKVKPASTIASAQPDGYWYRIASPPWSGAYYAVANTVWNGDVEGRLPYTHNTDWAVPDC